MVYKPLHPLDAHPGLLAASHQAAVPEPAHPKAEQTHSPNVGRHSVVLDMPPDDRTQPFSHRRDGVVQAFPQLGLNLVELGLHPLAYRMPQHREPPVTRFPANVREAEEIERLGSAQSRPMPVFVRIPPELQQACLCGVQLQAELCESFAQLRQEPLGIRLMLESRDDIVRIPHGDNLAAGLRLTPPLDPEVEDVVQVHVRQHRRSYAPHAIDNFEFERVLTYQRSWNNC